MTATRVAEYIDALRREGQLMAAAVQRTAADAPISTCPGWRMRDLVWHTGGVHRWAAAHVRERRAEVIRLADPGDIVDKLPDDAHLAEWFQEGLVALVDTLADADPDVMCGTFLPAPSPLLFWARRQTHETTIQRVDAEHPGGGVTAPAPSIAADGIDELLTGFVSRPRGRLRTPTPRILAVEATDTGDHWTVHIGPDPVRVTRGPEGTADTTVSGRASDVYLMLWNRPPLAEVDVTGDETLLGLWRESVQIRWT